MSSLDSIVVFPVARAPTTVVDGDVVLSGIVLISVALALAFVLHHYYVTAHRHGGPRGAPVTSSSGRRGMGGIAAAAASGGQGVDPVALRALPVTLYRAEHFAEPLECAVCLAELCDGEAARFLPKCGHGFHAECVDLWLRAHPTCPLCRVDVDEPGASPTSTPSPLALPPVLPESANYSSTHLPTNVLFWGSQDAVTTARTVGAVGGASSSAGATVLVVEIPETAPAVASREDDAAKPLGLARLASLRRLWSRGRREVGAGSARSCGRATAGAHADAEEHGIGVAVGNVES